MLQAMWDSDDNKDLSMFIEAYLDAKQKEILII